jgi:hypothetical protein
LQFVIMDLCLFLWSLFPEKRGVLRGREGMRAETALNGRRSCRWVWGARGRRVLKTGCRLWRVRGALAPVRGVLRRGAPRGDHAYWGCVDGVRNTHPMRSARIVCAPSLSHRCLRHLCCGPASEEVLQREVHSRPWACGPRRA